MKKPLIVFCPWGDVNNSTTLSGLPYYLFGFFKEKFEVVIIDSKNQDSYTLGPVIRLKIKILEYTSLIIRKISREKHFQFGGVHMAFNYLLGKRLEKIAQTYPHAPILTLGVGITRFYNGNSLVFNYTDGLFTYKVDYYADRNKLTKWERYNINKTDINGIKHSDVMFCTSDVIRQDMLDLMHKNKTYTDEKVINIGTGSNLPEVLNYKQPLKRDCLNICFIYSDFIRKGGDVMLKIAELSKDKNYSFHFVGKIPAIDIERYNNVVFHGFINKKKDLDTYLNIIKSCSINIMPTRGDLTPHIICECNSYGIPTIANNIGGIKDLLGEGGLLIEGLNENDYMSAINIVSLDLNTRSIKSFQKYQGEQKWSIVAEKISLVIEEKLSV